MKKKNYKFDPESLSYNKIEYTTGQKFVRFVLPQIFAAIVVATIAFFAISSFFDSAKERQLKHQNQLLAQQYESTYERFDQTLKVLEDLQKRDENIYKSLFESSLKNANYRHDASELIESYAQLTENKLIKLNDAIAKRLDSINNNIEQKEQAYEELYAIIQENPKLMRQIPGIQPVKNKDLQALVYGFGTKLDPVYKTPAFHKGLDYGMPSGSEVYATGDGIVAESKNTKRGYGEYIRISHGFNYVTIYAHLSKSLVRDGQRVKRGDLIGYVGNSGKSVAPHLHYEVRRGDDYLNPVNFFFLELNPKNFIKLAEMAAHSGQSLD